MRGDLRAIIAESWRRTRCGRYRGARQRWRRQLATRLRAWADTLDHRFTVTANLPANAGKLTSSDYQEAAQVGRTVTEDHLAFCAVDRLSDSFIRRSPRMTRIPTGITALDRAQGFESGGDRQRRE